MNSYDVVGSRRGVGGLALTALVLMFLVIPTLLIIPMSFSAGEFLEFPPQGFSLRWHHVIAESEAWRSALGVSLRVAAINVIVSLVLGMGAAYGLVHWRSKWREPVFALLLTPMVFPVILMGIGTFYVYAKIGLLDTLAGLVLAHATLSMPVVLVILTAALAGTDPNLEKAARALGATRLRAFWDVTFPQLRFATASAGLFAFLTSFDEVVVTLFISGGEATTLTKKMFSALRDILDPSVAAISTWVVVVTAIGLAVVQLLPRGSASASSQAEIA
jgi:putative spermidine/putrescine transport system permease protein